MRRPVVHAEGEADALRERQLPGKAARDHPATSPRAVMNIEGLGDATVDRLVEAGMVSNVADIYSLTGKLPCLKSPAHGQEARPTTFSAKSRTPRNSPLDRAIYGLGTRFVGERTADSRPGVRLERTP